MESALRRNIPVIPILVNNAVMPAASQLPESLVDLAYRNGTIVSRDPDFHNHMDRLVNGIQKLVKPSSPKAIKTQAIELKSEKRVDYTKLRDLLAAGKWNEADQETLYVMLQAAARRDRGWLNNDSIDKFPCKDLRTINQLWLHYSNGKFGFSVQKEIYESLSGTIQYDREVWYEFCNCVGWRKTGNYVNYSDYSFNVDLAPAGHLPQIRLVSELFSWGLTFSYLAQRLVTCNI